MNSIDPTDAGQLGRPRTQPGLYALTKLQEALPEGPARDAVRAVLHRPYAAALAALLIAAQLGSRSDWSGADELQDIGQTLANADLPALEEEGLYRAIADRFGISHDGEEG